LNKLFVHIIPLLVLFSCAKEDISEDTQVNLEQQLDYIINSNGDTVKTGVLQEIIGKKVEEDTLLPIIKNILSEPIPLAIEKTTFGSGVPTIIESGQPTIWNIENDFSSDSTLLSFDGINHAITHPKLQRAEPGRFRDNAVGHLKYWDVDQGMNSSYCLDTYFDSRGYLWIATYVGLTRFDGMNFLHYGKENGIPSNLTNKIDEDSEGNIWLGSNNGIIKFDGNSFRQIFFDTTLTNNQITDMYVDPSDRVWFSGRKQVYYYKDGIVTNFSKIAADSEKRFMNYGADDQGNIWFGTDDGLCKYDGYDLWHYGSKQGLNVNKGIFHLMVDQIGNVWYIIDGESLGKFDGNTFTTYGTENNYTLPNVKEVDEDAEGNIWISSSREGLCKFDGENFEYITTKQGLSLNNVISVSSDNAGGVWVGSEGAGINYYNPSSFHHFTEQDGLKNNVLWAICQDNLGQMWYGSVAGLTKDNGRELTHYTTDQNLPANFIRAIEKDKSGVLWVGSNNGAFTVKDNQVTYFGVDGRLPGKIVKGICIDSQNNKWFATNGGLCKYDDATFTHYTTNQGLASNNVVAVMQSSDGAIWIGTSKGISKIVDGYITTYTTNEGLSGNQILCLKEDNEGNMWVGTYADGLNRFDGENFEHFNTDNGLSNNTCWAIRKDSLGRIWTTTERGVSIITKREDAIDGSNYRITTLNKQDGLKGEDFYTNSAFIDKSGTLNLGSGKGLSAIDLQELNLDSLAPETYLYSLELNQHLLSYNLLEDSLGLSESVLGYDVSGSFDSTIRFQNMPTSIVLPYQINHLTFHFGAIDWKAPHKIRFSYKLVGLEDEWSIADVENKADYRSIPPGEYEFKLKAKGQSDIWGEPVTFSFEIEAPWWETKMAIIVYIFIIIFILYLLYRRRTAQLKKRQKELEKTVKDRTEEVVLQKEELAEQHQEIMDSITYAKRIQNAILPPSETISKALPNHFIYYQPKDIVAGDFYWFEYSRDLILLAAADCTGHGVPGAMVSVVCHNALNRSVREFEAKNTNAILDKTRELVIETLAQHNKDVKDGMDMGLCRFDKKGKKIQFSGANNPLWVVRKTTFLTDEEKEAKSNVVGGEYSLIEFKADKQPIGMYAGMKDFSSVEINTMEDDIYYLFTDGYADQFGGEKGKKMKYKPFKQLLLKLQHLPLEQQKEKLKSAFEEWKGDHEQVDDVCVIGIKLD
jgi:ligand-binding sensor domain-containing protein/serine phosphatase RsbU (regulator of sigma subunit)